MVQSIYGTLESIAVLSSTLITFPDFLILLSPVSEFNAETQIHPQNLF